jgi:hypothetical protein
MSGTMTTAAAIAKLPRLDAKNRPNMKPNPRRYAVCDMRAVSTSDLQKS